MVEGYGGMGNHFGNQEFRNVYDALLEEFSAESRGKTALDDGFFAAPGDRRNPKRPWRAVLGAGHLRRAARGMGTIRPGY